MQIIWFCEGILLRSHGVFLPLSQLPGPITDPVAVFLIIMAIMLVAPLLFERIRLPGIVGLILAGVVVGPHGIGILDRDPTIILLGTVGLLFLMFMAGLETSLDDLKFNADKAAIFGLATFAVPMILGTISMLLLGYSFLASILVASCFASHTLIALPVATKLGIMRAPAVTTTLGGTIITNILALLVLAVVVKAHQGTLTLGFWLFLIPALTIYTLATLWGLPKLGRWFFRKFGHDEGAEFTFVVASLFVVSYAAQLIEIEPIIGAFLAGIAITGLIPQLSPLMNRIQFIGNTLFVPFFLISVGMLINPGILISDPQALIVAGVMIVISIVAKFIPAWGSGKLFGLQFPSIMVIFGMSVAQAASTLAAITVAYQIELVDQATVNGIIAMILVTCIASPWVTARWGKEMKSEPSSSQASKEASGDVYGLGIGDGNLSPQGLRVLVPVANPNTEDNLLQLALILTKTTEGTLLPLHILSDSRGPVSAEARIQQQQLLAAAEAVAHASVTPVEPIGRVDESIDKGISRVAEERNATLIICGWKGYSTYRDNFFGDVIDKVLRRASVPVLIARFGQPIQNTQRVFLAFYDRETNSPTFPATLSLAQTIANELKASLELLQGVTNAKRSALSSPTATINPNMAVEQIKGNFVSRISRMLRTDDLLILIAGGHQERFGVSALGVEPEAISRTHPEVSMIVIHFPRQQAS